MDKGIIYDVQLSSNADIEFLQITPTFDSRRFTSKRRQMIDGRMRNMATLNEEFKRQSNGVIVAKKRPNTVTTSILRRLRSVSNDPSRSAEGGRNQSLVL